MSSTVTKLIVVGTTFLFAALCTLPTWVVAQEATDDATREVRDTGTATNRLVASTSADYRVGPRDVIEVKVHDAPELSGSYEIGASGTFLMPYIGRVTAAGRTTEQLAVEIGDGLRGKYLRNPIVSVAVKLYNSKSYFIQGAVHSPGMYQIDGAPSVLRLVAVAGGLAEDHGSQALILRERPVASDVTRAGDATAERADAALAESAYDVIAVNLAELLRGEASANIALAPGDIVHVSPAAVFYVAGEVRAPGAFPLKDGTTLRQAVSLAQGLTFSASPGKAVIFREETRAGGRREIPVDLRAVMDGKHADVPILENDVVIVPNSRAKSVGAALLSAFGMSAARIPLRY